MRKFLLTTTGVIAALALAAPAMAGDEEMAEGEMMMEPVSVSISGYAYTALSTSGHNTSPTMKTLFDPGLSGSATMDNGLKFGVSAKLQSGDENTLTVDGAFGQIQLGDAKHARGQMRIASAGATGTFGVNGPYWGGVAEDEYSATVSTDGSGYGGHARDTKIVYMSPSVGGIQLGASYAPDGSKDDSGVSDQLSAALTFSQDFGDAGVSLNVGYQTGDMGKYSPTDLNAGASITIDDITLSGGMRASDNGMTGADAMESTQMDIGATMAMGSLTLSAGWASTDNPNGTADTNMYALAASYPLGEGVRLDAQVDFGERDKIGDEDDNDWVQFLIGTGINF